MVFSSLTFLYLFLPGTMVLCFLAPPLWRNGVLLLASLFFYFYGEQLWLLLMLGTIGLSFGFGLLAERLRGAWKRAALTMFLICCLGLLGVFKYADLFVETANALAGRELLPMLRLPLPIGISFYTFQSISYAADVYRGRYPAERNLIRLATYVSFFPQLIAGPIVRYDVVSPALRDRKLSWERFGSGAFRFVVGLGKKVLLADRLFAFCQAAAAAKAPSVALAWAEGLLFLLYVYYDFSGYSDMAIGLASCFGFDIPENFDYPLISAGIREFWRRWHISLGTWFRDYVYIPLGGNRRGLPRTLCNLLVVWAMTGLWHGAGWSFVIWGLSFGLLLALETLWSRRRGKEASAQTGGRGGGLLRRLGVLTVTVLIFVWFRFPAIGDAAAQLGRMFGKAPLWSGESAWLLRGCAVLLPLALLGATPLPKRAALRLEQTTAGSYLVPLGRVLWMALLLGVCTAYLVDGSFSPFLYFRF